MARRRQKKADRPKAANAEYRRDDADVLVLRGAMTPATREQYRDIAAGGGMAAAASQEDHWQRSVEFLFERLAVSWDPGGAGAITSQKELLGRFRFADTGERHWIRDVLRAHLAEHFPELPAP